MILLVDDNQDLRTATRSMLEALGFDVLEAANGQVAWQQFQQQADQITSLLTDLRMPGLDGAQLIRKIRSRSALPIVLMSTHLSPDVDEAIAQAGAVRLDKPFSAQELQQALERAEARSATLSSSSSSSPSPSLSPSSSPSPSPSQPEAAAPVGGGRWVLGLAAGVVLALGVGSVFGPRAPELPAPVLEERVRGSEIQELAPTGPVASQPQQLHWRPVADAGYYQVEVLAVDGRSIWRGETGLANVALPESVRADLLANVAYYWRVRAYDADGAWIGTSAEARFRVIEPVEDSPNPEDS